MKRIAAILGAACGIAAGLCCSAVSASAASVTLTPEQSVALFGEQLPVQYWNGTEYVTNVMNYLGSGVVYDRKNTYFKEPYWYDNKDEPVLIYQLITSSIINDPNTAFTVSLNPVIDIQNINELRFSCGFSNGLTYPSGTAAWINGTNYNKSIFTFVSDYNTDTETVYSYNFAARDTGSGAIYPMCSYILPDDAGTDPYFSQHPDAARMGFTTFQCNLVNTAKKWSWYMNGDAGATGIVQSGLVTWAVPGAMSATPYNNYLFFISCPYISDDYVVPGTGERPEYEDAFNEVNDNLTDILEALNAIYAEQQRSRNILIGAAADLNLLQQNAAAIFSDVHSMAGDVHSIAGAFDESSLPDIGAGHAAFDSVASSAFASADSMMAQDLPQSVIDTSSGIADSAWDFITALHLHQIFPVIIMLLIIHFTIFQK